MAFRLDDMDRKILKELQADAAQSLDDIARNVGSSKTPVWNRIRKMNCVQHKPNGKRSSLKHNAISPLRALTALFAISAWI